MRLIILLLGMSVLIVGNCYSQSMKWETFSCEYINLKSDVLLSGRCHKEITEIDGNFAYILKWPSGNKVTVEYVKSQSGNHIWKINGEPSAAIEINRENLRGFSLDLNQILEWQDRPHRK